MPSAQDFLNAINGANNRLDGTNSRLDDVKAQLDLIHQSIEKVNQTLNWGFGQLITLGNYTNQALFQNDKQNETIICILEHISKNTCELWNESHKQTGLQINIDKNTTTLAELFAATHAEAALTREREQALKKQIEECCPPEPEPPPCGYQACPVPGDIPEPPPVDPQQPGDTPPG
jgi:hypothetical protein